GLHAHRPHHLQAQLTHGRHPREGREESATARVEGLRAPAAFLGAGHRALDGEDPARGVLRHLSRRGDHDRAGLVRSACVRDPKRGVGGMNHFLLPQDSLTSRNTWLDPALRQATRYGSYAMESLINDLLKVGASRERLEIKLFGGGRVLTSLTDVGARNIDFVRDFVRIEGLRIAAEDVGGMQPRKIIYFPAQGRVRVRKLRAIENRSIADREQIYLESLGKQPDGGEVELFE